MAFPLIPGEMPLAAAALQPVPCWCPMAMQMALYDASGVAVGRGPAVPVVQCGCTRFALSLVVLVALLSFIVTHPPVFLSFVNWELFRGVI
jgi:hypothetical protein